MSYESVVEAENAVAAKLAEAGADVIRRPSVPEAAPAAETPAPPADEPAAEAPAEAAAAAEDAPAPSAPTGDPAVAAYLNKYGGDVNKALQAAVSAQRKLGELGNELGEHRQQQAEYAQLQAKIDQLEQMVVQQPQPVPHVDAATVDWFDQAVEQNPAGALEWARQQRNDLLFQRGLSTWKDIDPFSASRYANAIDNAELERRLEQRLQSAPQADEGMVLQTALTSVISRHPEFNQYSNDLGDVIQRYPAAARGLTGNQQEKEQAIETLFRLAEGDTLRAIALSGATPETPSSATEVATATTSQDHPNEAPAEPTPLQAWREEFRELASSSNDSLFKRGGSLPSYVAS